MRANASSITGQIVLPMLGLLTVSLLLGLAFNATNPLGVRSTRPGGAPPTANSQSPLNAYGNETISFVLNRIGGGAGSAYQNEVLTMAFTPPLPQARPATIPPPLETIPTPPAHTHMPNSIREMTWQQVKPLLQSPNVVLVDARAPSYYQADHIPGAISLPFNAPPAEMAAFEAKYPRNSPVIVYCGGEDCSLARRVAEGLVAQHGYTDVAVLFGGYAAWRVAEAKPATP